MQHFKWDLKQLNIGVIVQLWKILLEMHHIYFYLYFYYSFEVFSPLVFGLLLVIEKCLLWCLIQVSAVI